MQYRSGMRVQRKGVEYCTFNFYIIRIFYFISRKTPLHHYIHSSSFLVQFNLPTTIILSFHKSIHISPCDSVLLWYCSKRFAIPQKKENFHKQKNIGKLSWKFIIFSNYSIKLFLFVSFSIFGAVVVLHKSLVK